MSITPSIMIPLGTLAPSFNLLDTVTDKRLELNNIKGTQGTLVMFICNHCPFVKHLIKTLVKLSNVYADDGIRFIAISANDVDNYPEDSPDKMKDFAAENGFSFPYLYDETQDVAKAYQAACTPDFFLFDASLCCVYRGQFDSSRPSNIIPVDGENLTYALDALLNNQPISQDQVPSIGCNIKWKP